MKHFIVNREKARQEVEEEEGEEGEEVRVDTPEREAEVDSAMSQDGVSSDDDEGSNREQQG